MLNFGGGSWGLGLHLWGLVVDALAEGVVELVLLSGFFVILDLWWLVGVDSWGSNELESWVLGHEHHVLLLEVLHLLLIVSLSLSLGLEGFLLLDVEGLLGDEFLCSFLWDNLGVGVLVD